MSWLILQDRVSRRFRCFCLPIGFYLPLGFLVAFWKKGCRTITMSRENNVQLVVDTFCPLMRKGFCRTQGSRQGNKTESVKTFPSLYGERILSNLTARSSTPTGNRCFHPLTGKRFYRTEEEIRYRVELAAESFRPLTGKGFCRTLLNCLLSPMNLKAWVSVPLRGKGSVEPVTPGLRCLGLLWFPSPCGERVLSNRSTTVLREFSPG